MVITKTATMLAQGDVKDSLRLLDVYNTKVAKALNGRLRFGTYTSGNTNFGENLAGQYKAFTSSGTPDAENTVAHNLGAIPIGRIIIYQSKAGGLYGNPDGTGGVTVWTSTNAYFKCSVASVAFLVFLLK